MDQSSGWPLGQSPGDPSDLRVSILHSLGMPRLGPLVPLAGVEDCGPLLQLSSGGNPGDPARTGRPMFVVERLFDIGLTNWFISKGGDRLAP